MQNTWLIKHRKRIDELKTQLIELNYRGSNIEVPLTEIHQIIDGSLTEILRLQGVVTQLTIEFQKMKKITEEPSDPKEEVENPQKPDPPSDRLLKEDEQPSDPKEEVMK